MAEITNEQSADAVDVAHAATATAQSEYLAEFEGSVFAAYAQELFVPHNAWFQLEQVITTNRGGNYALTGPRGSGKSWVISRCVDLANSSNGLGAQFTSPSDYDALSFLTSLARHLSETYISRYLDRHKASTERMHRFQRRLPALIAMVGLTLAYALVFIGIFRTRLHINGYFVSAGFLILGTLILYVGVSWRFRKEPTSEDDLYDRAVELRRHANFATAVKDSSEQSASGGAKGVSVGLRRARETAFTERGPTVGSLSQSIRDFLIRLSDSRTPDGIGDDQAAGFGPIVIGIDELDKMDTAESIAKLLRDVKGIFDVRGVHFLVSISNEAARNLDLAGVQRRNEFNSSFYQVFTVQLTTISHYIELFNARKIRLPETILARLVVLSGGVARELVRLGAIAIANRNRLVEDHGVEALIIESEINALQAEVEGSSENIEGGILTKEDLLRVHGLSSQEFLKSPELLGNFNFFADKWWRPADASPAWDVRFAVSWHRLLVRGAIAGELVKMDQSSNGGSIERLQDIARRNINSPVVARALVEELHSRD